MTQKVLSTLELVGNATVTGLPAPSAASDATPKSYVDALINSLNWKDDCRAASTANINLASPGATIDGVSMTLNDRFLAKDQSTQSQNGIYVWNGAASPATRAADADAFDELEGARVRVTEGTTNANTDWVQTQVNGVIGTNTVTFQSATGSAPAATETVSGIAEIATQAETDTGTDDTRMLTPLKGRNASWLPKSFKANIGDGSSTQLTVTHNLNTRDVRVQVCRNATPWDTILCDVERDTVISVVLRFATAPTAGQFRVLVTSVP